MLTAATIIAIALASILVLTLYYLSDALNNLDACRRSRDTTAFGIEQLKSQIMHMDADYSELKKKHDALVNEPRAVEILGRTEAKVQRLRELVEETERVLGWDCIAAPVEDPYE